MARGALFVTLREGEFALSTGARGEGKGSYVNRIRLHHRRVAPVVSLLIALAALGAVTAFPSAASAGPVLSGASFESGDGNIAVDTPGNKDWLSVPTSADFSSNCDLPDKTTACSNTGITADQAFGQGAKEDIACPTEVTGSIPPNKSDLTRFYLWHERGTNGHIFVDMAWERNNVLGNANMDFEFNQSRTLCGGSSPHVPTRTAGDVLVTFDFANGGTNPILGLNFWLTAAADGPCYKANSVPCWGNHVDLNADGISNGAVNTTTLTDTIISGDTQHPAALEFGEAGVDLTAAGVFSSGHCESFGQAYLKSRSSSAFTAEMKDFVPPVSTTITNCGGIDLHKTDFTTGDALANVPFTLYVDAGTVGTYDASDTTVQDSCSTDASGDCSFTSLPFGSYCLVEGTPPTGYTAADPQCVTLDSSHTSFSLTFEDHRSPVTINVIKNDDSSPAKGINGVTFNLVDDIGTVGTYEPAVDVTNEGSCTTSGSGATTGTCSIASVLPGTYCLVEDATTVPTGYDSAAAQCFEIVLGVTTSPVTKTFVDPRQFKVITLVCEEAGGTLYASAVNYDSSTDPTTNNTPTSLSSTAVEDEVCGLSGTYVHGDVHHGSHSSRIVIPQ